jgi:Spy/CpxP family protein refolding chaperone
MKTLLRIILVSLALGAPPAALAQASPSDATDLKALSSAAQKDKRALVASTLNLTTAEARKFWPVYDSYQREFDMLNRRQNTALEGLVARDRPLSDLYARNLANELTTVEEQEVKARRKMHNAVMRALPPRKAARYLQLESKIRAVRAYDIAVAFPLVQ